MEDVIISSVNTEKNDSDTKDTNNSTTPTLAMESSTDSEAVNRESPPAYSSHRTLTNTDSTTSRLSSHSGFEVQYDGLVTNNLNDSNFPFPGLRPLPRNQTKNFFRQLSVLELPFNLAIAQRSLTSTVSVLYAIMIIVTCMVFVSTELITEQVPMDFFETKGFYTYLYTVSILFMIYIFLYVLRAKSVPRHKKEFQEFINKFAAATGVEVTAVKSQPGLQSDVMRLSFLAPADENNPTSSPDQMLVKMMTSENDKSHGSMMLRIGAIAFGLGTMIYTGLEFVHFFEMDPSCDKIDVLHAINPILHMVFTFMQMYYVFMHARLNIQRNKIVAKFGLMHMLATNCCIWIRTLVRESAREILVSSALRSETTGQLEHEIIHQQIFGGNHTHHHKGQECESLDILGDTIESCSVYLFPFIIEYSMIGGHILYNMWRNVGRKPKFLMIGSQSSRNNGNIKSWDWSSSSTGLFLGLSALTTLIITLILYFSLVNQEEFHLIAVLIINVSDTVINTLMIIATIIGFFQVRNLKFVQSENEHDTLLIIGAFGIFLYASYTIVAGSLSPESLEPTALVIINGVMELLQVNLQLLFVADLKQKKIRDEQQISKPGRQVITFLVFCNLGLWITYNFEIQKVAATPDQLKFYGFFPWIVIQRLTLPLCVFFRFHSTVVFAELWKNVYFVKEKDSSDSTSGMSYS